MEAGEGAEGEVEPVGRGEPTARGVGSEGCGDQERMRVGAGLKTESGAEPEGRPDASVGPGATAGPGGSD